MNTHEHSKVERKQLREVAAEVYEAEAHALLEELEAEFQRWREGEMLSSELLSAIHEFHQHSSRELWSLYQGMKDPEIVARGIALDLISPGSIAPGLLAKLRSLIEFYARASQNE